MSTRSAAALGFVAVVACANPLEVSDCPAQVQITVSSGTTPEIDWTPRCRLSSLTVSAYGSNYWIVHSPPQFLICPDYGGSCPKSLNTLYPPIRFGVVPRDAFQAVPPPGEQAAPLHLGWPYEIRLARAGPRLTHDQMSLAVDTFVVTAAVRAR
jgi:hypothetical protein